MDKGKAVDATPLENRSYQDALQFTSPSVAQTFNIRDLPQLLRLTVARANLVFPQYDLYFQPSGSEEEVSEYDEEEDELNFLDSEHVRDDDYLEHRRTRQARQARQLRQQSEVLFRRGRGRSPGSRRTYFDVVRTISTRSHTIDGKSLRM